MKRLNRRFAFEKPPFAISIAKQPVRFFRAHHETTIERFIVEEIARHLDCEHTHRAISDKGVARALNPENRALARTDPDLEPLRDDEAFRAALEAQTTPAQRIDRRRPIRTKSAR